MTVDHRALTPLQKLVLGYLILALLGWALLCLPGTCQPGVKTIDHLFIAASALTTTGLTTVNVADTYTFGGELITLVLFQIGGIGYMSLAGAVLLSGLYATGDGDEMVSEDYSIPEDVSHRRFLYQVLVFTAIAETIGTIVLTLSFSAAGEEQALWKGLYTAVSAFCTAGFSLFPNSLVEYRTDGLVNIMVSLLSLAGSFGFFFFTDILAKIKDRDNPLNLTTLVILRYMFLALILTFLAFFLLDDFLRDLPLIERLMAAAFQSISTVSTTGFSSVPIDKLALGTGLLVMVVMFIGASPSGTGGGIKNTTFVTTLAHAYSVARERDFTSLLGCRLPPKRIHTASSTLVAALIVLMVGSLLLVYIQPADLLPITFEATSALGTVGLSWGLTDELTNSSKYLVILLMFIGRVGALSIFQVFIVQSIISAESSGQQEEDVAVEG